MFRHGGVARQDKLLAGLESMGVLAPNAWYDRPMV